MDFQDIGEIFGVSEEEFYAMIREKFGEDIPEEDIKQTFSALFDGINHKIAQTYTLEECLSLLRKDDLVGLMKQLGFHGYSKMRKDELIQYLHTALTAPDFMPKMYASLTNNEVAILWQLCAMNVPIVSSEIIYAAVNLLDYGLCYLDKGERHLVMPEELKQAFQQAKEDDVLAQKQRYYGAIYDMCNAAVYFYGVYPISELLAHLEETDEISISEEDFVLWYAFSKIYRKEFFFEDGYIVSIALNDTPEDVVTLQRIQRTRKHKFWPDEEQIRELSMEQWLMNEELYEPFWEFAPQLVGNPFGDIMSVSRFVEMSIRSGAPFNAIVELFTEQLFELESPEELETLVAVLQNIWNNTPMWENCGYSPAQLGAILHKGEKNTADHNKVVSLAEHKAKKKKKKKKR